HIQTVRELDAEMTDLKLSTNATTKELKDFYYSSAETAKQLGTSTQEIMSQTNKWARLGYSIKEASALAKNAVILNSISPGLDMDDAAESLSAALQSFRLDADDALDGIISKINVIGHSGLINNSGIADILNSTSAAMSEANNTLEETIALSAAASQATPDTGLIGDTLNALAKNIQDKGSIISKLTETRSSPGGISPFTDVDNDTLRSTYQILSDIASVWNDMDTANREQLISSLAAGESGDVLSSIITNFDTARNSMTLMAGSAGSAMQSMDAVYDGLDFKLNRLSETGTGIAQNLFGGSEMKTVVDGINAVGNAVEWVTGKLGLLGTSGAISGLLMNRAGIGERTIIQW
ncbi:MAG: phage tail tape measure protein, partial [Lachnospiraceae bacterium]|nr:phage tail tape measure protein [Lachnospiraceae bacterium]